MQKIKDTNQRPSDRLQHQLGTELGLIFACCHLLRESMQKPISRDQLRLLSKIEHSAGKIRDLRADLSPDPERVRRPARTEAALSR